ncbi:unnamed protein product, partial [marine sediment metagenome]
YVNFALAIAEMKPIYIVRSQKVNETHNKFA